MQDIRKNHNSLFAPQSSQSHQSHGGFMSKSSGTSASQHSIKRRSAAAILSNTFSDKRDEYDDDSASSLDNLRPSSASRTRRRPSKKAGESSEVNTKSNKKRDMPIASSSKSKVEVRIPTATVRSSGGGTSRTNSAPTSTSQQRKTNANRHSDETYAKDTSSRNNSDLKGKGRATLIEPAEAIDLDPSSEDEDQIYDAAARRRARELRKDEYKDKGSSTKTRPEPRLNAFQAAQMRFGPTLLEKAVNQTVEPPDPVSPYPVDHFLFSSQEVASQTAKRPPKAPPTSAASSSKENRDDASTSKKTPSSSTTSDPTRLRKKPSSARDIAGLSNYTTATDAVRSQERDSVANQSTKKASPKNKKKPGLADFAGSDGPWKPQDGSSESESDSSSSAPSLPPRRRSLTPKKKHGPAETQPAKASSQSTSQWIAAASTGTKSGTSRFSVHKEDDHERTIKKVQTTRVFSDNDFASGNSGPVRSSSPVPTTAPRPKAKPSARASAASHRGKDSSSSSLSPQQSKAPLPRSESLGSLNGRPPPANKQSRSVSGKNAPQQQHSSITPALEKKASITTIKSSPEKRGSTRPITLSSQQSLGIDEDQEKSVEVAPSRIAPSSLHSSAIFAAYRIDGSASPTKGKPSPVFSKKQNATEGGGQARPKPVPKASRKVKARRSEIRHESPLRPRPRSQSLELVTSISSPTKRRRLDTTSLEERRQSPAPSLECERDSDSFDRSESPSHFEQTQVLWRLAALGDGGNVNSDGDLSDDSDGDVPLSALRQTVLCPFCDRPLPPRPSNNLVEQLERLCQRVDLEIRDSVDNPMALRLPATDTVLVCKRHRDESEIIPAGEEAGYPRIDQFDWKQIARRISKHVLPELIAITEGKASSEFFSLARKEWEAKGARKMGNLGNDWASFHQELPGYYGQKGFDVIMDILNSKLLLGGIVSANRTSPLDIDTYLRRVMVPETAVRLIQRDINCSWAQALDVLQESRNYGAALFGDVEHNTSHLFETQVDRKERRKQQREQASQRDILINSQGEEAEALKLGEAIMENVRKLLY